MINILVREIYKVDTISKINNKAWEVMSALLSEDEDYMFDFRGIELVDPWLNDEFSKFIRDERVHLQLYSSEKTAYTINTMCVLGGMKPNRVFNTDVVAPKAMTPAEKLAIEMAKQLQDYFEVDETDSNSVKFNIYKRFDQLGSVNTIEYMEAAIRLYVSQNRDSNITLDLGSIFIQKNILELISSKIDEMLSDGIRISAVSTEKEVNDKIGLHRHLSNNREYTVEDRLEMFRNIKPGTVGMLSKYKSSRGVDEFGRQGNGEVVSCRVAIFRGMRSGGITAGGNDMPVFEVYNGDKFYTRQHWELEHDFDELDELEVVNIIPDVTEVGLYGEFLGSKYHFMEPIQYDTSGSTVMYSLDDNGKLITEKMTIPERIETVLEDWNVEYDRDKLKQCLNETNKILNI